TRPVALSPDRLLAPGLAEAALAYLERVPCAWRDASHPFTNRLNEFSKRSGELAAELARLTGRADPQEAVWAAQLAPLGWLAVTAVDADAAARCRGNERFSANPAALQRERWGLDHDAIARRLATRWKLPERIAALIGQLSMPFDAAKAVMPDADLFAIVV